MAHIAPHILLQIKSASFKGIQSKRNLQAFEKEIGAPKDPKRAAKAGASRQREKDRKKVRVENLRQAVSAQLLLITVWTLLSFIANNSEIYFLLYCSSWPQTQMGFCFVSLFFLLFWVPKENGKW